MASQRVEFPLPECALPSVRVTPEQHEELRAFAIRTAQEVLRDGPTWGRSNVNAARDRGWKVSQRSPEVCFMMKTTTTSKPVKSVKKATSSSSAFATTTTTASSAHHAFSTHTNSSVSSTDESPRGADLRPTATTTTTRGSGGAGGRAFMGSVRLAGHSLDDVISAIHCENTKAQRRQLSKSYGAAYLDCCVMQTLETAKAYDPFWYLGLKWTALKTPFEKIVNHREFVYLEHSGTHINAHGQRMLYRIIQSVCLDDFGGERCYFGLTRAHLEAAYVYWMDPSSPLSSSPLVAVSSNETNDDVCGVLTVCMKGLAHPKGKVPLFLIERLMKKFWKAGWTLHTSTTITGVGVGITATDSVSAKQLRQQQQQQLDSNDMNKKKLTLGLATQWVADADRKNCALCHKKFRFGRRMRHHCRACGEVICRSCTQYFLLTYAGSVGSYPIHSHHHHENDLPTSKNGYTTTGRKANPFAGYSGHDDDDEDDLPATLGGDSGRQAPYSRRGRRLRGSSENDAVMVGKVCRRCVELKQVEVRRETMARQLQPPASYPGAGQRAGSRISSSTRVPSRRTGVHYGRSSNHVAMGIQETDDEHDAHDDQDDRHDDFPIMGHEDDDGDFFVPETPLPSHAQQQQQHQFHQYQQHHEDDDTTSEFSIGDFDQSTAFKPFATLDLKSAQEDVGHDSRYGNVAGGHQGVLRGQGGQAGKMSIDSSFSQSGFSVGVHAYDDDDDSSSDNEDEFVDYHSEPDHELEPVAVSMRVRHPQLGQLTHLEEERFTMPKVTMATAAHQRQYPLDHEYDHQRPVPPPIAQQFALTAAALSAPRYTQTHAHARRLRIEDLLADTDDEGEEDYSTSPPLRPSALNVPSSTNSRLQPHQQLTRTASAPPLSMNTRERAAPPPLPMPSYHYRHHANSHANRESNLSSISFSSFDADFLIDASALDDEDEDEHEHDEDAEYRRQSTTIDEGDDSESDEILFARIQKIQDEVLRRQLLSSSASSVASSVLSSSLSSSLGPATIRFNNRNVRAPSSAVTPSSISLSESSTISSNGSFLSTPSSLPETANATATATVSATAPRASVAGGGAPRAAKKAHKAMQQQVESSIADQAQLLYYIQKQRATLPDARAAVGLTSP